MNRLGILVALVASAAVACSHPAPPVTPLPPDNTAAGSADVAMAAKDPAPAPAPAPAPPPPPASHDTEIEAPKTSIKLVSPGKGKAEIAKITPVAGARTATELRVDFTATQNGQTQPIPTLIFRGDTDVVGVDNRVTTFKLAINATDTKYPTGTPRLAPLEQGLAAVVGMTMNGSVLANGTPGKLGLHIDAPARGAADVMELLKVTWMPMWPVLPDQAIAPGAKWQVVSSFKLAGQIDVTETIDYELVAYKNKTWTIKGTSKMTGEPQTLDNAPVTAISGTGAWTATLADGALIPTLHGSRSATFEVTPPGQGKLSFSLVLSNDVGVSGAPSGGAAGAGAQK